MADQTSSGSDKQRILDLEREVDRLRRRCKHLEAENAQMQRALVSSVTG